MNFSKNQAINILGIILVFFGLLTLMLLHLNHHAGEELETEHEEKIEADQWLHIAVGFPISVLGALLLILAEKRAV